MSKFRDKLNILRDRYLIENYDYEKFCIERDKLFSKTKKAIEKRAKYVIGDKITSLDELCMQDVVIIKYGSLEYFTGKDYNTTNRGWFMSYQFTYIANLVYNGKVYKAIKKENGNGNNSSK